MKTYVLRISVVLLGLTACFADSPNTIYILADDLGYGDVHALNPEQGRIETPHMDYIKQQTADKPFFAYDMENDLDERHNLYASRPEVAAGLLKLLEADFARGRSTERATASNDVDQIKLWKSGTE